jgi:hypothetical protein
MYRRGVPYAGAQRCVDAVPQHGHAFTLREEHAILRTQYGRRVARLIPRARPGAAPAVLRATLRSWAPP